MSKIITYIIALLTLSAQVSQYISMKYCPICALLSNFLPILLIANVVLVIYLILRKRMIAVIPAFLLIVNYNFYASVLQLNFFPSKEYRTEELRYKDSPTLKVATYNIGEALTAQKRDQIIEAMIKEESDMICFQEFNYYYSDEDTTFINKLKEVWPYAYVIEKNHKYLYTSIFSKYPIIELSKTPIHCSATNNCNLMCDIKFDDEIIRLFNVHLNTTGINKYKDDLLQGIKTCNLKKIFSVFVTAPTAILQNYHKREKQCNHLQELIQESPYPTILCGDFNFISTSYNYQLLVKQTQLQDGFLTTGSGYMYTYRNFLKLFRIDYILYSNEFWGVEYYSKNLDYSDHNPIFMSLKIRK